LKRLWILLLLAACGDGLAGKDYRGEPLISIDTQLGRSTRIKSNEKPFKASLFWTKDGGTDLTAANLVEQPSVAVNLSFPGRFEINVFEPPTGDDLPALRDGVRVGLLLIYEDVDEDGRFDEGELRGSAVDRVLLYAPQALDAVTSITGRPLTAGYNLARVPMSCTCGVEVGSSCDTDASCGTGGVCVKDAIGLTFSGGYCVATPRADGCKPRNGTLASLLDSGDHFIRYCQLDSECRTADGYSCCSGSCLPETPGLLCDPVEACPAPTGSACDDNQACGVEGLCVKDVYGIEFPGGFCTTRRIERCEPVEALLAIVPDPATGEDVEVWVPPCSSDDDCRDGYACVSDSCEPVQPLSLEIFDDPIMLPLCNTYL